MSNVNDTSKIAVALSITSYVLIIVAVIATLMLIGTNHVGEGIGVAIGSFITILLLKALAVITEACQRYIDSH